MKFRKSAIDRGFILADAELEPESEWFDPGFWRRNGSGEPLGRGRGVAVSAGDRGQWVLRHYHRGGLPARLVRDCYVWRGERSARPVRELHVLAALKLAGAPVPQPVAARVKRSGPCYRGDILMMRVRGARSLADAARQMPATRWSEVGRALRRFHSAGGWHADLNARNILITTDNVFVIDLDRGRCDCIDADRQRSNVDRLLRSLLKLDLMPAVEPGWRALMTAYEAFDLR